MWLLVLSACLPTVAQSAVRASGNADWLQVCTSTGMVWVKAQSVDAQADGKAPAPVSLTTTMQCDWCLLHGGAVGLPSLASPHVPSPDFIGELSADALSSPHLMAVWQPARSRAPPAQL